MILLFILSCVDLVYECIIAVSSSLFLIIIDYFDHYRTNIAAFLNRAVMGMDGVHRLTVRSTFNRAMVNSK